MEIVESAKRRAIGVRAFGAILMLAALAQVRAATGGEEFLVGSDDVNGAWHPSVVVDRNTGDFLVAWTASGVWVRRYHADGSADPYPTQLNTAAPLVDTGANPVLATSGVGQSVAVWTTYDPATDRKDVVARRLESAGQPNGDVFTIGTGNDTRNTDPAVAMAPDGTFAVVWWSFTPGYPSSVRFQRFSEPGAPVGPELVLGSYSSGRSAQPDVAIQPDGTAFVVWKNQFREISLVRIDAEGNAGQPMGVAEGAHPKIALTANGPVVAWRDDYAYARRCAPDGTCSAPPFIMSSLSTVSATSNYEDSYGPALALSATVEAGWVAAWQVTREDGGYDLYARRYNRDGVPEEPEFAVNAPANGARHPALAMAPDGAFTAIWTADRPDQPEAIFGRQYEPHASGPTELGIEFESSEYPTNWGDYPMLGVIVRNNDSATAEPGFAVDLNVTGDGTFVSAGGESWTCQAAHCVNTQPLGPGLTSYLHVNPRATQTPVGVSSWLQVDAQLTTTGPDLDASNNSASARATITDTSPDPFSFEELNNVEPGTMQTSNVVTITGIGEGVGVFLENGGEYSIDGAPFTSQPGRINNGSQVQLRHMAGANRGNSTYNALLVGGGWAAFVTNNVPADRDPDAFQFTDQQGVPVNTTVTSDAITVSGIDPGVTLLVHATGGSYNLNGGAFMTGDGYVGAGAVIRVRHQSSMQPGVSVDTTLTVGTVSDTFTSTTVAADTTPDPFSFTDVTNVGRNTLQTSNAVTITGLNTPAPISVTGGVYSVNGGTYTQYAGTISNGQTVRARHYSSGQFGTRMDTTVSIGDVSDTFSSTTLASDTTPDPFVFTDVTGVARGALTTASPIAVTGVNDATPISVSGGSYSINGGAFTSAAGTVTSGQTVRVQHTSSASFSTATSTVLTVGGVSDTFTSTTLARDATPDAFGFTDLADVARGSLVTSNVITVGGINDAVPISVSGGSYSINNGAFTTSPGTISNGQTVRVQHTSSPSFSASMMTTLTVGGVTGTFTSTTLARDGTPDVFAFTSVTDVARSTLLTSNAVTVAGINDAVPIGVTGGTYSINGGAFTSAPGTVQAGQTVRVQHTSSSAFSATVNTVLTVGGVRGTFTSTTAARDVVPDAFAFANRDDVARHAAVISDEITITGINDAAPIGISGGQYSVDGGNFTATNGTVTNGQKVRVKHTAAADFSTARNTVLTVGGVSGTFTSTTEAEDLVPDAFSFQDQTGAIPTAQVTSNTVTIAGINSFSPLTVSGGMYSVNGSGYTSVATKVRAGDRITLRVTAATLPTGTTSATLTIGGVSDTWTVQTLP